VTAIRELLFTFVGPGRVWVVARVDIDDGLRGTQVKSLVRGIESGLKHGSEEIYRVDIVSMLKVETYVKAPIPVMARPTMSVCMVSVPSKVWIASKSAMCRATW